MKVSASILGCDFLRLGAELEAVARAGADAIHLDVMDGHFVGNLSFGVPLAAAVRKAVTIPIHTHLMVKEPQRMIPWFLPHSDLVTFHIETTPRPEDCIAMIRHEKKSAGVSLNPDTPIASLEAWVNEIDDVLVMSVFPGLGGQRFIPAALDRIRELKALLLACKSRAAISVDGGVNPDNCRQVAEAGADWLITGSTVFRSADYAAAIRSLKCLPLKP